MTMLIDSSTFFTIENLDPEPYVYNFRGRQIVLQPNVPKAIPFEQIMRLCGDPRSGPDDKRNLREDWVMRLKQFYGIYDDAAGWENRPRLKVTDEEGNTVSTPLWDPAGQPQHQSQDPYDYETMMAKVARHERDLAQLRVEMEAELRSMQAVRSSEARADIPTPAAPQPLPDSQVDQPSSAPTASQARRKASRPEPSSSDPAEVPTDSPTKTPVS